MKKQIFTRTLNKVCTFNGVKKKDIFTKNKKQFNADSRHLLYYVCMEIPHFKISYLQKYLKEQGYDAYHSEIIYGVKKIKNQIEKDQYFKDTITDFKNQCINL